MRMRVLAMLAALALGGAAEARAWDCFDCDGWCCRGTTTIYGSSGYRMYSRCCNGQRQYYCYDVAMPACVGGGCTAPFSERWADRESGVRLGFLDRLKSAWR